jgi:hypothetical protein
MYFYVFFLGALKTKHDKTMLKPQKMAASFSQLATVVSFRVIPRWDDWQCQLLTPIDPPHLPLCELENDTG